MHVEVYCILVYDVWLLNYDTIVHIQESELHPYVFLGQIDTWVNTASCC